MDQEEVGGEVRLFTIFCGYGCRGWKGEEGAAETDTRECKREMGSA